MSKPVYALYLIQGFKEAWYQLSKQEQDNLKAKAKEIGERSGDKWLIGCNSRWADEEYLAWTVAEYPDMETLQKRVEEFEKLQWWRYVSVKSILGTKMEE